VQLDDRDIMMKEEMRRESAARRNAGANSPVYVGLVVELRDNFGFLQAICSAGMTGGNASLNKMAEQLYFQDREGYSGLEMGHQVYFQVRDAARGPQAVCLRRVPVESHAQFLAGGGSMTTGTVVKEADNFRTLRPMVVQLHTPLRMPNPCEGGETTYIVSCWVDGNTDAVGNPNVTFLSSSDRAATLAPRRGDDVEVVLRYIPGSVYCVAAGVKVIKTKSEKQVADMAASLEASGVLREQGIVESVRAMDQYGFMQGADRNSQIYFRFDDLADSALLQKEYGSLVLVKGVEVEFYVIQENAKGRLSDRAIQIKVLKRGTVKTEYVLAKGVTGTVISEPRMHPREEPGMLSLDVPIPLPDSIPLPSQDGGGSSSSSKRALTQIELWPRCAPDCLIFRLGDKLRLDVHYYRPEKLHFARDVHMQSFRLLGRESGRVFSIKQGGYGFINVGATFKAGQRGQPPPPVAVNNGRNSVTPNTAAGAAEKFVYFSTNAVVGPRGEILPEQSIQVDMPLSFDAIYEETKPGEVRLGAVRVAHMSHGSEERKGAAAAAAAAAGGGDDGSYALIQRACLGTVVRNPQREKGDLHGSVRLTREGVEAPATSGVSSLSVSATAASVAVQNTVEALVQFKRSAKLCGKAECLVEHIYLDSAIHFFSVLSGYKEEVTAQNLKDMAGIACEYVRAPIKSTAAKSMKVYLLPGYEDGSNDDTESAVVKEWRSDTRTMLEESTKMGYGAGGDKDAAEEQETAGDSASASSSASLVGAELLYSRNEASDSLGPLSKDALVSFDICLDKASGRTVARGVRLSDEPVPSLYHGNGDNPSAEAAGQIGVLETVFSRAGSRYGYLRAVPSDEKLFWHASSIGRGSSAKDLLEGRAVTFACRRRGGSRVAVDLTFPEESGDKTKTAVDAVRECMVPTMPAKEEDKVLAVVVGDGTMAVPLSVPQSAKVVQSLPPGPHNRVKLWDLGTVHGLLNQVMTGLQGGKINPRTKKPVKSDGLWAKESIHEKEEAGAGTATDDAAAVPPPAAPTSADEKEKEKEKAETASDSRFYAPLGRHVVPIADAGMHAYQAPAPVPAAASTAEEGAAPPPMVEKPGYAPGTLIKCVLRYSPLSRQVLAVHDTAPASPSSPLLEKRTGLVSRVGLRLRVSGSPAVSPRGSGLDPHSGSGVAEEGLELIELRSQEDYAIALWPSEVGAPAGSVNTNISSTLAIGDQVEYYQYAHNVAGGGKPFLVAVATTVTRRGTPGGGMGGRGGGSVASTAAGGDSGIVFRGRGELNAGLQKSITKQVASKISGKTGVVMAKGPAVDGSVGFVPGWRTQARIQGWKEVPWAHLLPWQELMQVNIPPSSGAT
jgi:hypothetical protein